MRKQARKSLSKQKEPLDAPEEDTSTLLIDHQFRPPRPLDVAIASVWVKTTSNNPSDGYDLVVNAAFGQGRIRLQSKDIQLDVELSIKEAHLEVELINSNYSTIDEELSEKQESTSKEKSESKIFHNLSASGEVGLDASGNQSFDVHGQAKYGRSFTSTRTTKTTFSDRPWRQISGTTLKLWTSQHHLDGKVISNLRGWRITPIDKLRASGVIVYIKVREDYLRIGDVRPISGRKKWKQRIAELTTPENEARRKYFDILLQHLLSTELAKFQRSTEATVAADAVILVPRSESPNSVYSGANLHELRVSQKIEKFLAVEKGHEPGALLGLGLKPAQVRRDEDHGKRRSISSVFVPHSPSPYAVSRWYERISLVKVTAREAPRHIVTDLTAMGLVRFAAAEEELDLVDSGFSLNPAAYFQSKVESFEVISVAKSLFTVNPDAPLNALREAMRIELNLAIEDELPIERFSAVRAWAKWLLRKRPIKFAVQRELLDHSAIGSRETRIESLAFARQIVREIRAGNMPEVAQRYGITIAIARRLLAAFGPDMSPVARAIIRSTK